MNLFGNPSFGHSPNKVPSQVLHFFGLKPYKNAIFNKEVVQKLKFPNNNNLWKPQKKNSVLPP